MLPDLLEQNTVFENHSKYLMFISYLCRPRVQYSFSLHIRAFYFQTYESLPIKSQIAGDYGSKISPLYTQVSSRLVLKVHTGFTHLLLYKQKVKPIQTKWDTKCQRLQMTQKHLQVALMMKT